MSQVERNARNVEHTACDGCKQEKKGGEAVQHLRVGLSETENVVNEQQNILALRITEVLGQSQGGQTDTGTGTWGFIHLSVHKSSLGPRSIQLFRKLVGHTFRGDKHAEDANPH